jgi:hypothetical protein
MLSKSFIYLKISLCLFYSYLFLTEIIKLTKGSFALIFDCTPIVALLQQTGLYFVMPDVMVQECLLENITELIYVHEVQVTE